MKVLIALLRIASYLLLLIFTLVIFAMSKGYEYKVLLFGIVVLYVMLIQAIDYAKLVDKKRR